MSRKDSGFHGSDLSKIPGEDPLPVQRSNTEPTRRRKHRKTPTESSFVQPANMETQRPASERRPKASQQKSTTSSSENSNSRSKGRGHGSKLSSRRTSCTIVDPSRPARHYRMKSFQTAVPTATSSDIDDVLALHFRSCSLFTNPSYHSNSGLPSPTLSHGDAFGLPSAASRFSSDDMQVVDENPASKQSGETIADVEENANTTMQWTSPCSRKREYERIDKANSGFRGFFRKVTPRCVSGPPPQKFYEKDQSDAGSVRRYRLDDIVDGVDDFANEKKKSVRPHTAIGTTRSRPSLKQRLTCF
ncbi:hypothetical protein EJ02DRAFT_24928 [Clathrospora elynae]|uniref:Uncharacterized protein n=1 Tax=Clathrospora elynae TaxID=706981 RepID=A0A6A5T246_9PLEO|nr:hypothetical protein EJ02DRAFT_24928 [Clathrospora elynae]